MAAAPAAIKKVLRPFLCSCDSMTLYSYLHSRAFSCSDKGEFWLQDKAPAKTVNPLFEKREKRFGEPQSIAGLHCSRDELRGCVSCPVPCHTCLMCAPMMLGYLMCIDAARCWRHSRTKA